MAALTHTGFGGAGAWPRPARDVFPEIAALTRFGYLGVDLFFVISGVITAIFGVMILVATGRLSRVRWHGLTTLGALTYPC